MKKLNIEIKGSISKKKINGKVYCYLKFRDSGKVKTIYLGKPGSERVKEIELELKKQKKQRYGRLQFWHRPAHSCRQSGFIGMASTIY